MTISLFAIMNVVLQAILQVAGIILLPMTKGFTKPLPTIGSVLFFAISLFLLARLQHAGYSISTFIPFLATLVPLLSIGFLVFIMHEPASWLKVSLLLLSCCIVGAAARIA